MNTAINKAKAMMSSPAGCAALLDIASNPDKPLERFAEPLVSFWLTSSAMDWCDIHHESNAQALALMAAKDKLELALRIAEHPDFTWWYEPLDLTAQIWVSPQWPGDRNLFPDSYERFAPESWRTPTEIRAVPQTVGQVTSTLRGGTTSQITAYALYSASHVAGFPLPAWQLEFYESPRVLEINQPSDWHDLCVHHPAEACDGRLIPNWQTVSEEWDGIHITLGGVLSCEQSRFELNDQFSEMRWIHTEATYWLKPLDATGTRLPDFEREPHEMNLQRYPYENGPLYGPL